MARSSPVQLLILRVVVRPAFWVVTMEPHTGSTPNANVFGDVLINNYANITAGQTGAPTNADGIRAFNYGVGNVTVIDGTLNNVANGPGTVITDTYNGINAYTYNSGNILVSMVPGDSILSGGSGMNIGNDAIIIDQSAHSVITINAYGAINSGSTTTGSRPAGIQAGYNASVSGSTPDANVYGDVFINNYANITAGGGDGIRAFNYGVGNVTVADGTLNDDGGQGTTISAPGSMESMRSTTLPVTSLFPWPPATPLVPAASVSSLLARQQRSLPAVRSLWTPLAQLPPVQSSTLTATRPVELWPDIMPMDRRQPITTLTVMSSSTIAQS